MKPLLAALAVLAALAPASLAAATKELRVYHASLLRSGPNDAKVTGPERARLRAQHLAYRRSLYEAGDLLMYGPIDTSPDPTLRGMSIFRGDKPVEEIRRLVEADPYVKAGIMVGEVIVWLSEVPRLEQGFGVRRVEVPE